MRMTGTGLAALAVAAMVPAASAASLSQETDINTALFEIAVANEIRKECDSISPRIFTAIGRMNALKSEAILYAKLHSYFF